MRATNRGLVFKKLVVEPGISRPRLAQSLNLTKMSISKIVAELLQRGLIQEEEKIISGEAQPGLRLSPDHRDSDSEEILQGGTLRFPAEYPGWPAGEF